MYSSTFIGTEWGTDSAADNKQVVNKQDNINDEIPFWYLEIKYAPSLFSGLTDPDAMNILIKISTSEQALKSKLCESTQLYP